MNLGRFFIEIHGKFRNGKTLLCGESKFVDENRMKFVMKCSKMTEQLRTKWLRIKKRNVILNTTERGLAYENAYTWSVEKIF